MCLSIHENNLLPGSEAVLGFRAVSVPGITGAVLNIFQGGPVFSTRSLTDRRNDHESCVSAVL
jgi:hypothetical protein